MKNMKHTILLILLLSLTTATAFAKEYEIANIYVQKELPDGAKVKDNYNTVREAKTLFIPTKDYKKGSYEITLTKIDTGLYQIEGTDYVVELKYCYEYAYRKKAVMVIENPNGYKIGKVFIQ